MSWPIGPAEVAQHFLKKFRNPFLSWLDFRWPKKRHFATQPKVVALGSPKPQVKSVTFLSGSLNPRVSFNQASSPRVPSFRPWPRTTPRPTSKPSNRRKPEVRPSLFQVTSHFESAKVMVYIYISSSFILHIMFFSGSLLHPFSAARSLRLLSPLLSPKPLGHWDIHDVPHYQYLRKRPVTKLPTMRCNEPSIL